MNPSTESGPTKASDGASAAAIPRGEPARSLRLSVLEGCSSSIFGALTGGAVMTAFAMAIGASDFHLGLISAVATVSSVGGLLGARAAARRGNRKSVVVRAALVSRLGMALCAALPFVPGSPAVRVWIFLAISAVSGLALNLAANPWLSWMTDLVPPDRRGRYFAWRNTAVNAVGMAASYGVGRLAVALQRLAADSHLHPAAPFVPLFAASTVFTLLTTWAYVRQWEPPAAGDPRIELPEMFRLPLRHSDFRRFLTFAALWSAALGVAGPFFAPHMFRHLRMTVSDVALYSILSGIFALVAQPVWGRVCDRIGHRPVLAGNIVAVTALPLLWIPATPDSLWLIWLDAVLTGIFWPGLNLALFNLALGTAPAKNRASYLAVQGILSGLSGALGATAGGALAHAIGTRPWAAGPLPIVNFHVLFALTSVLRIALLPLALRLTEHRARTFAALVRTAGDKASRLFADGIEGGLAFIRRWTRRP